MANMSDFDLYAKLESNFALPAPKVNMRHSLQGGVASQSMDLGRMENDEAASDANMRLHENVQMMS